MAHVTVTAFMGVALNSCSQLTFCVYSCLSFRCASNKMRESANLNLNGFFYIFLLALGAVPTNFGASASNQYTLGETNSKDFFLHAFITECTVIPNLARVLCARYKTLSTVTSSLNMLLVMYLTVKT